MRSIFRRLIICLIVAVALPGAAMAQDDLQDGIEAARRGDFASARQHFERAAPDPRAAYMLGQMMVNGEGGPVDFAAAAAQFEAAARQGHGGAMTSLGYLYDNGWGVARDGALAQEFYIAAAGQNLVMAANNLAYLWARQGGLLEQALCLSAQTLAAQPDSPHFLDTYGFILLQMRRGTQSVAYFRRALKFLPDYADAWEHLGDAAVLTGDGDAASFWRRALANPRDERQRARVTAKLGGAPGPGDINAHPPFALRDPGLPSECAVPSV